MKKVRLVAIIAAVATALGVYLFFNYQTKPAQSATRQVVVAAVDIAQNTKISSDMLSVVSLPTEAVLPQAMTDKNKIVGSVANADIATGEQILSQRLVNADGSGSNELAYTIQSGMRAITIAVDKTSGLHGMIKPGNTVDIVAQFQRETTVTNSDGSKTTKTEPISKLLLQNIKVLATDQALSKDKQVQGQIYSTLTLEVTPEQALKLSFSENDGKLRAILRSPLDKSKANVPNATEDNVIAN